MTTKAIDLVTMGHALGELGERYLGDCVWTTLNDRQRHFIEWWAAHRESIAKLHGLEALASEDYEVLNSFLQARGFDPMFAEFDGVGVASLLDMLVEWATKATPVDMQRWEGDHGIVDYPAFKLSTTTSVDVFHVVGEEQPLARLRTKNGDSLWLIMAGEPEDELALMATAQRVLSSRRMPDLSYEDVVVPMLDMELEPDLSWMLGMHTDSPRDGSHAISQAFQMFRLRANEMGARVRVATGFATTRGSFSAPTPLTFNQPFAGFFTQAAAEDVPIAAFYADTDVWRLPEGGTDAM